MHRILKGTLWVLAAGLVLLVLVQLIGSPLATHFANQRLAQMPQFTGHLRAVRLELWRGTISVRDLELTDRANPIASEKHIARPLGFLRIAPVMAVILQH